MTLRKRVVNYIRGWLPKEPHLPPRKIGATGLRTTLIVILSISLIAASSIGAYVILQPPASPQVPAPAINPPTTLGLTLHDLIYIMPDGSLSPSGASNVLTRNGDVFSFNENISNSILIERNNTILDGSGHSLQGPGQVMGVGVSIWANNCTVKNINIIAWNTGIEGLEDNNSIVANNIIAVHGMLVYASNFTIYDNTLTGKLIGTSHVEDLTGIDLYGNFSSIKDNRIQDFYAGLITSSDLGVTVVGNQINNNSEGLTLTWPVPSYTSNATSTLDVFYGNEISNCNKYGVSISGFNSILLFGNDFINNTKQAVDGNKAIGLSTAIDKWDNGTVGNYWSNYQSLYPKATAIGNSTIENTPYKIYTNNTDNYPLTQPTYSCKPSGG
jgi:hypothetical protein